MKYAFVARERAQFPVVVLSPRQAATESTQGNAAQAPAARSTTPITPQTNGFMPP